MLDFIKLQEEDLDFFLEENLINTINLAHNDKIAEAEELFDYLGKDSRSLYTFPVLDLWISGGNYNITQQYTMRDLSELSTDKKEEFAKIFGLSLDEDFLDRLTRILRFLGLITHDSVLYELIMKFAKYKTIKTLCLIVKDLENMCKDENFWRNIYNRYGQLTSKEFIEDYENLFKFKEELEDLEDKDYELLFIIKEVQKDFLPYSIKPLNIKIHNLRYALLGLGWNQIGDEEGKAIGNGLAKNNILTALDIRGNQIGDEGGKAIGNGLTKNNTLTELMLGWNQMGDEGGEEIGNGLSKNNTLIELMLDHNKIWGKGGKAIGNGLANNTSLIHLDLKHNKIGDEGSKAIGNGLSNNTSLKYLNLEMNNIEDKGAEAIGNGLAKNNTLLTLILVENEIGDEGVIAIINGLVSNTSLTYLDLGMNNKIGDKGAEAIIRKNSSSLYHYPIINIQ